MVPSSDLSLRLSLKASSGRGRRAKNVIGESKIPGTSQNKNKQAELADLRHRSVLADPSARGRRSRPEEAFRLS